MPEEELLLPEELEGELELLLDGLLLEELPLLDGLLEELDVPELLWFCELEP